MLSIVSWNICRRRAAWAALLRMRDEEGVDLALLQEVGKYVPEGVERGGEDWIGQYATAGQRSFDCLTG